MNERWFRVPLAICYADDEHLLRRGPIPTFKYLQDVLHCWNTQLGVNRYLAQRAILREVKIAGLLKGINRLADLRHCLLKHERLAGGREVIMSKGWIKKAREVEYKTARLDPTVKVLAVISGSLVTCKGNHFRRRYAYREGANDCASVGHLVRVSKQPLSHDPEQNTLPNEIATLCNDDACNRVRDALEVLEWEQYPMSRHVMPNVGANRTPTVGWLGPG